MGDLRDILVPGAVIPRLVATNKRQVLQGLADALGAAAGLDPRAIFDALLLRERLAGTGVGEGVAIPHARMAGLDAPIGAFARLEPPIDFDALDGEAADLVFVLLAPADKGGDHLKALARVSRSLRRPEVRDRLRAARTADDVIAAFAEPAHARVA